MIEVRITRRTVVAPGREAAAGAVLKVEPLTAHALLCATAAELIHADDAVTIGQAVRAENARLLREDKARQPLLRAA